jgi:hypothetical protein
MPHLKKSYAQCLGHVKVSIQKMIGLKKQSFLSPPFIKGGQIYVHKNLRVKQQISHRLSVPWIISETVRLQAKSPEHTVSYVYVKLLLEMFFHCDKHTADRARHALCSSTNTCTVSDRPWVSNPRPSTLYYASRGHIWKLCICYRNYTVIDKPYLISRWVWMVNATPRPFYPRKETQYPVSHDLDRPLLYRAFHNVLHDYKHL